MIGGDYFGMNTDHNRDLDHTNLVDLLDASHVSWKSYQENYPGILIICQRNE
jgi:hypothetical protein